MPSEITEKITARIGIPDLIEQLTLELSGSELNSLLLDMLEQKATQISSPELLQHFKTNRFVRPVAHDWLPFLEWEFALLQLAAATGFEPLELAPVSPLGTCSVLATVHQHKVLSALRGTEVVADATNVLALESAIRRQELLSKTPKSAERICLCTTHRHVRTQVFDFPGFTPHFKIFCMTTAGRDEGNRRFEQESLLEHLRFYLDYLINRLGIEQDSIYLLLKDTIPSDSFQVLRQAVAKAFPETRIEIQPTSSEEGNYYRMLQFKIMLTVGDNIVDIADGGFVDWTQQLLSNRKERLLISGMGTELLYKLIKK